MAGLDVRQIASDREKDRRGTASGADARECIRSAHATASRRQGNQHETKNDHRHCQIHRIQLQVRHFEMILNELVLSKPDRLLVKAIVYL